MPQGLVPRTFRMRLTLLSVSLSAAILLGFGGWCWRLLYSYTGLDRLDGEMRGLARNQLAVPRPGGDWDSFQDALDYLGDLDPSRVFAFTVLAPDGGVQFRGDRWPEELIPETLVDLSTTRLPPRPDWFRDDFGFGQGRPGLRGARGFSPRAEDGRRPRDAAGDAPAFRENVRMPDARPPVNGPGAPPAAPIPMDRPAREVPGFFPPLDGVGPMGPGGPPDGVPRLDVVELANFTRVTDNGSWRISVLANPFGALVLVADLTPFHAEANALRNAFLAVLIAALVSIGAGGWFLAQRALRPVDQLVAAAEMITVRELDRRLPEEGATLEFARLNRVFNAMLERLDRSFKQATRFSADAAHELKTPLTVLQGQLNQLLQEAPPGSPLQQRLGRLLEEVQRLSVIIRRLLLLSLADAGRITVNLAPIALDEFLESIIEDAEILAPDLAISHRLEPGLVVAADEALLQQAVQNLVNNAIKYNVPEGKIRIELFRYAEHVRLTVSNTSTGIAEADRKRVFHRFYRGDPAHSRAIDGVGLGLSLAREIVRAHHGKLWLADAPEGWVMFILELPATSAAEPATT
jgi:two-component system heavy metal sensor histidine kinase CusS